MRNPESVFGIQNEDFFALRSPSQERTAEGLKPRLLDLLRQNNVALVLQDQSWMPHPKDLGNYDLITADFSYIRWLGNRKDIEKLTTTWNSTIIDRTADLQTWVDVCEEIQKRGVTQYVYANNHYSGFAPATVLPNTDEETLRRILATP